jgi:predicted O-methyltransferase YrrM
MPLRDRAGLELSSAPTLDTSLEAVADLPQRRYRLTPALRGGGARLRPGAHNTESLKLAFEHASLGGTRTHDDEELAMDLPIDPKVRAVLERLHAASAAQEPELGRYFLQRAQSGALDWARFDEGANRFLADKLVALEPAKAAFCAQVCTALRARVVVEAGTSFGASTLYLAAAVRTVVEADGGAGRVIATEYEPAKAAAARANFAEAELDDIIELREGDLRETLADIEGPVDFALIDIWVEMAHPALELIVPRLRPGAVVVADNTAQFREAYAAYFAFVNDPVNGLWTTTLPFEGGLEFTVRR